MKKPTLEDIFIHTYKNTIKALLISRIKDDASTFTHFQFDSIERQREIEDEIEVRSENIAIDLVKKLKNKGFLKKEPDEATLRELISETLKEHGGQ